MGRRASGYGKRGRMSLLETMRMQTDEKKCGAVEVVKADFLAQSPHSGRGRYSSTGKVSAIYPAQSAISGPSMSAHGPCQTSGTVQARVPLQQSLRKRGLHQLW